ncbi:hypothetical protein [Sphingomonas sp. ACRSK]|uniref:hypothetical protein n=1 Tax=Sphingomonas sp. ACRSK TaxID=2918213 RepID=UPI001EF56971|nr:hypothetical protein [Sphingomonas sp. ACRSK]MCG7349923.1 hypothetical protein [Sphingomonas sp. ACRSK]
MRQVSRQQLIDSIRFQVQQLRPQIRKMLDSHDPKVRGQGCDIIAAIITDKALHRFEILSSTPLPPGEVEGYAVGGKG